MLPSATRVPPGLCHHGTPCRAFRQRQFNGRAFLTRGVEIPTIPGVNYIPPIARHLMLLQALNKVGFSNATTAIKSCNPFIACR